jgi:uncharacterized protein (TIGR02246 family)
MVAVGRPKPVQSRSKAGDMKPYRVEATVDAQDASRRVVSDLERAQQTESVDDFVALFRVDATWVTGGGHRLIGRDEIAEFTRAVLPGAMRDSTARYNVEHVVIVREGVAVVSVRQIPVALDGHPLEDRPEGRPTLVIVSDASGHWTIVAGQNTLVAAG